MQFIILKYLLKNDLKEEKFPMAFRTQNFAYNTKKQKLMLISENQNYVKLLMQTPSLLGYTKASMINTIWKSFDNDDDQVANAFGRRRISKKSQKDIDFIFKDVIKNIKIYDDLITDILSFDGVINGNFEHSAGKNTLVIVCKQNIPLTTWRDATCDIVKKSNYSLDEIQKIKLNGVYRTGLNTILKNKTEIMYFIEKAQIKNESQITSEITNSSNGTFNTVYRWNYAGTAATQGSSDSYSKSLQYNFSLPDGGNVVVVFDHHFKKKITDVEFSRRSATSSAHSIEVTGEGNAIRILSTVLELMKEFCAEYKPKKITFSAAVTEDNQSRSRVYGKMLQRHAPKMGYTYKEGKKYGGSIKFTMERNGE